ncbi:MAG: ADP-ribosylation factor-like protein [Promethearchaeota archaeon]
MSESAKNIIKFFCDRFLDIDYYPTSLKAVLDCSVDRLKNITNEEITKFLNIGIKVIRDLTSLDLNNILEISKTSGIRATTLQNAIVASYLIANAWQKRSEYLKKNKMKVVIAGLDYAGKTSLINRLISNQTYGEIVNLAPTVGANVEEFQTDRVSLIIWDLGGQKAHIDEYLSDPERFFVQVDVLIFVFDTQDDRRYDEAIHYFTDVLKILDFLEEFPYVLVLLNKVDADLKDDPDFQIKMEYLTEKVANIFIGSERQWTFEIIPTSIYNFYSNEPEIAKSIKNIFSKDEKKEKQDQDLTSIEEKLQTLLDININLLDKVVSEVGDIKRMVARLAPSDLSKSLFSIPFEKVPDDFISSKELEDMEIKIKKEKIRKLKKKEKKELIKKRDKNAFTGPPQRLKELPKPKSLEIVENGISHTYPVEPPSILELKDLKPPPPPPPEPPTTKIRGPETRLAIISELKEMFVKRGIVK